MDKSIHSKEYQLVLAELKKARLNAGITQVKLAERLNVTQTFISKCERNERRLDIVELRSFCNAIGADFTEFISGLELKLKRL